ncbi:MAG: hypothetical protein CME65_09665 [Halobacteriovoraceae bacterium]|nr:hypothetical protein [Halobacteriovoraceae bacterium]
MRTSVKASMEKYYYVQVSIPLNLQEEIDAQALSDWSCTGIEDFSIDEATVDAILGERSYSGGDIPDEQIFEVEGRVQTDTSLKKYYFDSSSLANAFMTYLKSMQVDGSHLIEKEAKDWNEEWKKNFSSIVVSENLKIVPEWEKKENQGPHNLYIYPGMGFGTGSHETTFLCLKFYEELGSNKIDTCMDFGCGSGILGLAVYLKNKTKRNCLYDIDESAIENTKQNIELNNFKPEDFEIYLPHTYAQIAGEKFDLVFANILQQTLIQERKKIFNHLKKNSILILSGLLRGQEVEVIEDYQSHDPNLELVEVKTKGDWLALMMRKNQ